MGVDTGKVYFVLYLAVVLELLIIIVERDDAEQHLKQKQKETMRLVESILSQLQSGSGTEGINTRPQDEITIPPKGVDIKQVMGAEIKSYRKYIVEVGITDVSNDLKRRRGESEGDYNERLKKLVELSNVAEIEYQIFFSPSDDPANAPVFPTQKQIMREHQDFRNLQPGDIINAPGEHVWEFIGARRLELDKDATYNNLPLEELTSGDIKPVYPPERVTTKGPALVPPDMPEDSVFFYSTEETRKALNAKGDADIEKRAFTAYFQPPDKQGWYKLRFTSRTNRILGVRADQKAKSLKGDTKVNIGTVQISVENLQKVKKELRFKLEKFRPPTEEILIKEKNLEKFNKQLKEAKARASKEEEAVDLRNKINLYGYIVKLLAPGQSVNFSQNRGSIEFNVRVITPKPPVAEPAIVAPVYLPCFDEVPPAFEFTISPYQGDNNKVSARIIDQNGVTVSQVNCRPLDEIASEDVATPGQGGKQQWRGVVNKNLAPGKYQVEVNHTLHQKPKTETFNLEVFPTSLTEASGRELDLRMKNMVVYGVNMMLNVIPTSGGKIKSNQFRIYLTTDADQQRPPFEGLSIGQEDALKLTANADELTLKISWVQPYTGKEVVLYPEQTVEIKQEAPKILTNKINKTISGTEKKVKILITGVRITKPNIGAQDGKQEAKIKVEVDNPSVDIGGYNIASDPMISKEGDQYTITMEIAGDLPRGEDMLIGAVSCNMTARAINPINGKVGLSRSTISVPLNYEPEEEMRPGGRRPGGGRGAPPRGGGERPPRR